MIKKCLIISVDNRKDLKKEGSLYFYEILGLTTLERIILSARENGVDEFCILINGNPDKVEKRLHGKISDLKLRLINSNNSSGLNQDTALQLKDFCKGDDFLLVKADRVVRREVYRELIAKEDMLGKYIAVSAVDKDAGNSGPKDCGIYVCNSKMFDFMERLIAGEESFTLDELNAELKKENRAAFHDTGSDYWQEINNDADVKAAEKKLLKSCIKEADSFLSRNFTRPISLSISRRLSKYKITPNQITYLNLVVGIIAALLVSSAAYVVSFVGLVLFEFTVILDGCDGEVARLKFCSSKTGAQIDTVIDFFTRVLFFTAIAVVNLKFNRTFFDHFIGIATPLLSAVTMFITTVLLIKYDIPDEGCFSSENLSFRKQAGPFKKFIGVLMKPEGFTTLFFVLGVLRLYRLMLVLAGLGYIGFTIFNIIIAVKTLRSRAHKIG